MGRKYHVISEIGQFFLVSRLASWPMFDHKPIVISRCNTINVATAGHCDLPQMLVSNRLSSSMQDCMQVLVQLAPGT